MSTEPNAELRLPKQKSQSEQKPRVNTQAPEPHRCPHATPKFGVVSALPKAHSLKVEARIPVPKKANKCQGKKCFGK